MKYLDAKFSTPGNSRAYVDGWERCFGEEEGEEAQSSTSQPPDPQGATPQEGATLNAASERNDSGSVEKLRD